MFIPSAMNSVKRTRVVKQMYKNRHNIRKIGEFDLVEDNWILYCQQLDTFFKDNDVKEEHQVSMLIFFVGKKCYNLMVILAEPRKPNDLSYSELVSLIREFLQPSISVWERRYNFWKRTQKRGESIIEYAAALQWMIKNCNYIVPDCNLCDQFICGVRSGLVRQCLFAERSMLTFTEAVNLATSIETVHCSSSRDNSAITNSKHDYSPAYHSLPTKFKSSKYCRSSEAQKTSRTYKCNNQVNVILQLFLGLQNETLKSVSNFIKTQLCTIAISLTLFNSVRLPRDAIKHGEVPYLVVYTFWLLVAGLPTTLLQIAMGQLSQQDPVGVWRAVPILRGVGHLRIVTSYICCVYNMMYVALAAAYLIWIGKGTFPLRDCTKLHITPQGYENRMNASECFNATFLAPFTEYPQYLGIMAILIFILWFFVPILLFRLRKSLRVTLNILGPLIVILIIVLCTFLSDSKVLTPLFQSCKHWAPLSSPFIWHSAMVQALLSSQVVGGYLISAGGTVYKQSDARWTALLVISTNVIAGWLWVLFWESIGGDGPKDTSFISILVLIYQSSVSEKRSKEWPLLAFAVIFLSGIITLVTLLFPIYDKLHRATGDQWRLVATAGSAVGTVLTVAVLARGIEVASVLDELVIPVLAVFTTAVEIVGFVFIYGWCYLTIDLEFLTGGKLSCCWISTWCMVPILLFGVTGWWLRALIRSTWGEMQTLWPLVGVFLGILLIMAVMAAIAVAKEEQYNLFSKIAAAFRPSRLWGPEEPLARYVWMSQKYANDTLSTSNEPPDTTHYAQIVFNKENEKKFNDEWSKNNDYQRTYYVYTKNGSVDNNKPVFRDVAPILANHNIPRSKKKVKEEEKFRSPNICIAKGELGGPLNCNCNRHFTLNVPNLRNSEVTTSL